MSVRSTPLLKPADHFLRAQFYGIGPLQAIRRNSRKYVKVLVWNVGAVSYLLRVFGPITEEGIDHWQTVVGTKAAETGKNFVEAADDVRSGTSDS